MARSCGSKTASAACAAAACSAAAVAAACCCAATVILGLVHLLVDDRQFLGGLARQLGGVGGVGGRRRRRSVGASSPAKIATRARPMVRTARGRRRVVVRWECTVGLRLAAPRPGKGPLSMRVRTDGRDPMSTSSGRRAGQTLRCRPACHSAHQETPFATPVTVAAAQDSAGRGRRDRRTTTCARGAFRQRNAPRAHDSRPRGARGGSSGSAGERLLRLQAGHGLEVAQDRGELVRGPRLAAADRPRRRWPGRGGRRPGPRRWRGAPTTGGGGRRSPRRRARDPSRR